MECFGGEVSISTARRNWIEIADLQVAFLQDQDQPSENTRRRQPQEWVISVQHGNAINGSNAAASSKRKPVTIIAKPIYYLFQPSSAQSSVQTSMHRQVLGLLPGGGGAMKGSNALPNRMRTSWFSWARGAPPLFRIYYVWLIGDYKSIWFLLRILFKCIY